MTRQIQSIVFAACMAPLLPIGIGSALAKQCSVAVPSNAQAHWSYRMIDGRKCWYEGRNMLAKSSLRWAAKAPAQPNSDEAPASVPTQEPDNQVDADTCCWPTLHTSESFEARWRATLDAMGKY